MCHKNPLKDYFCGVKMVPQEVVLFLTLEVVLFLTLERLKRGTETNSPIYIYTYTHMYIFIILSIDLFVSGWQLTLRCFASIAFDEGGFLVAQAV